MLLLAIMTVALSASPSSSGDLVRGPRTDAQWSALASQEPELCYSGRRFGGKSWIGCYKAWLYACKYPGARVGLFRAERSSMNGTTLLTLRQEIVPADWWARYWQEGKSKLACPGGSEIHVLGLDDPGRVLGSRYGLVVIDQAEQITFRQFEIVNSCAMQVGMPWHQVMLLFNPEDPGHWAYRRYRPDEGDGLRQDQNALTFARVVHVQPMDLIDLLSETSRERFDRMTGVWRDRLRLGKWVAFEGSVFDCWDPSYIVDPPAEWALWGEGHELGWTFPPPDWPRFRGIDFGYEPDPYTCQWWTESPSGHRYLYRQTYHTRKTIETQAAEIGRLEDEELGVLRSSAKERRLTGYESSLHALNIEACFTDHHRGERAALDEKGVWSTPADKDILAGIESVRDLMAAGKILIVKNRLHERDPRLAEQMRPTCLEEEIAGYRWRTGSDRSEVGRAKTLPVDRDNHGLDAMRYVMHSLAGAPQVRVIG